MEKRKNLVILSSLALVFLVFLLATNLWSLPGPTSWNEFSDVIRFAGIILATLLMILVPVGLIWLIIAISKKKNKMIPLILLIFPIVNLGGIIVVARIVKPYSTNYAISRADPLIEAIEKYHDINHNYPDSLAELVPEFIDAIPIPGLICAKKYFYWYESPGYQLGFNSSADFETVCFNSAATDPALNEGNPISKNQYGRWIYILYD